MIKQEKYQIGGISVINIRNRNETRVADLIVPTLSEFADYEPTELDVQDIYALTLNKLKPRYAQECSIVLVEPVTDEMIKFQLRQAVQHIINNPAL